MSRPRNPVPRYLKHPSRDQARCYVAGRWVGLGKYNSPESLREYERVCAELRAGGVPKARGGPSVAEVLAAFTDHARAHYRDPDGNATPELKEYRLALAPLVALYAATPAAEFGPLALQAYRRHLIEKLGWCRTRINKQVGRIRRVFTWAASQELVPASVPQALKCVQGLQKGRTDAKESEPVLPAPAADVAATRPYLNRQLWAMVELQLLTGMRPGEVCRLKLAEVERAGEVWVWDLRRHKTEHHGKARLVFLGPLARAVVADFLAGGEPVPDAEFLFNPRRARKERFAAMRARRKSSVPPSQRDRTVAEPKKFPNARYSPTSYAHAVEVACERAGVPGWNPAQLRHSFATRVRKDHGLEAAQVLLGHSRADVTQLYAERDLGLALRVATEVG